jgi:hypothetical protein
MDYSEYSIDELKSEYCFFEFMSSDPKHEEVACGKMEQIERQITARERKDKIERWLASNKE